MEVLELRRASERREGGRRTGAERAGIGHAVWTPGGASDAAERFRPSPKRSYTGSERPPTVRSQRLQATETMAAVAFAAVAALLLLLEAERLELHHGRGEGRQGHAQRFPVL
jgi:hypothetical protein